MFSFLSCYFVEIFSVERRFACYTLAIYTYDGKIIDMLVVDEFLEVLPSKSLYYVGMYI